MAGLYTTGFKETDIDVGLKYVEKSYLMDFYADLIGHAISPALLLWGNNGNSQLGDNTIVTKSSPIQTIQGGANWKQVACGNSFTGAIKTDGTLWMWGRNSQGFLGDGTTINRLSPVQTIQGGTNWKQLACGNSLTGAIKTDGTLWMWGFGTQGQLGDNTQVDKWSPVQTIQGGTNWKQLACGMFSAAAVKTDGTLWMWGQNGYGQIGDNTIVAKSSPVQTIVGGTNWKQVACGESHTVAVKTDGTLWSWGRNFWGELGDNTVIAKSSPVQTIQGGVNWKQVACGDRHTAAIKTDGTLWLWGNNINGQLGDNTTANKWSPVQTIQGGNNWKQVACGGYHSTSIKIDCTLWVWGNNSNGRLGDNTIVNKSSPIQTIIGGGNWKQVSGGADFTSAIKEGEDF